MARIKFLDNQIVYYPIYSKNVHKLEEQYPFKIFTIGKFF